MSNQNVNLSTGEIINTNFDIENIENIPTASEVAGENPPFMNLKDHPELNGQGIIIINADIRNGVLPDGKITEYAICQAFVFPDGVKLTNENKKDYACMISSGSDNFMQRIKSALTVGFPFRGTLRNVGRAWFID